MSASDLAALITAITAMIGTVSGLIVLIVHIIRHQPIDANSPVDTTTRPGPVVPITPDKPAA